MSEEVDPLLDVLNNAVLTAENMVWRTNAMAQLTLRMGPGKFRKGAVAAGDPDMLFANVYGGKRADYIFCFEPVDTRPYEAIEMDETKVFSMLPGFEELMVKEIAVAMGVELTGNSFGQARAKFKTWAKRQAEEKAQRVKQAALSTDAERYRDNPLWGAF